MINALPDSFTHGSTQSPQVDHSRLVHTASEIRTNNAEQVSARAVAQAQASSEARVSRTVAEPRDILVRTRVSAEKVAEYAAKQVEKFETKYGEKRIEPVPTDHNSPLHTGPKVPVTGMPSSYKPVDLFA
ncbi:MAG: hypothetical protein HQL56_15015 [Magnetococcales bacterium]|nr:hypothetical protein [Magnetococcales bacterium]